MKKIILLFTIILSTNFTQAQKIKLSKGDVLSDGEKIMTYEREDWGTQKIHLFALGDGEEQILMIKNQNETPTYYDDDYLQIKFLPFGKEAEMKSVKSWKGIIAWLQKQNLFDENGKLIEEKVDLFVKNYDENITNRTIRY